MPMTPSVQFGFTYKTFLPSAFSRPSDHYTGRDSDAAS